MPGFAPHHPLAFLLCLLMSCATPTPASDAPPTQPSAPPEPDAPFAQGPKPKAQEKPKPFLASAPIEGYVVLHRTAKVWPSASEAAAEPPETLHAVGLVNPENEQFVTYRVLEVEGDIVAIQTISSQRQCTREIYRDHNALTLNLFVHRRALMPVLTQRLDTTFSDGTELHATTGAPLKLDASLPRPRTPRLFVDSATVAIKVPEASIGLSFAAATSLPPLPRPPPIERPPSKARGLAGLGMRGRQPLWVTGATALKLDGRHWKQAGALPWEMRRADRVIDDNGRTFLILSTNCVRVKASIRDKAAALGREPIGGLGMKGRKPHRIARGKKIFTKEGLEIGETRGLVRRESPPKESGGRLCWRFDVQLGGVLCFDKGDVTPPSP